MKRIGFILIAVVAVVSAILLISFRGSDMPLNEETTIVKGDKVEVFYFHFTRRCVTCQAVEDESKKALEALYPDQVKKGTVTFTAVNLDEESSKPIAEKCKITGQSLLIISGEARIDLTSEGFLYARNNPDKLKEEIKKTVDPLLKSMK